MCHYYIVFVLCCVTMNTTIPSYSEVAAETTIYSLQHDWGLIDMDNLADKIKALKMIFETVDAKLEIGDDGVAKGQVIGCIVRMLLAHKSDFTPLYKEMAMDIDALAAFDKVIIKLDAATKYPVII